MLKRILLLTLCTCAICAQAQTDWQDALQQWMVAEDMAEGYDAETLEALQDLAETRLNLNQATRQDLERLPFLSAQQVEELVEYLYRYGPIRTAGELQMLPGLDYETRRLLLHFVSVGQPAQQSEWPRWADVWKDGHHTLTATVKVPFYDRKGDKNGYLGYKYRHDVRYQFNFHNRLKFGVTGAQDSGEPFMANTNKTGYDHYNIYLQLRDAGRLEELNVGCFRARMGMGLVMNTSFGLGKMATLQQLGRSSHTLTAHASRSEADYMQGVGATVRIADAWYLTAFASLRDRDATLNSDGTARTLLTDGYHRTPTEISKKHNTRQGDLGISVGWRPLLVKKIKPAVSFNMVYTHLDRSLQPQTSTLYRRYAATGKNFLNASVDYSLTTHRLSVSGETAVNGLGAMALLHSLGYRLSDALSLVVLHRYYDKRYTALHGSSFGEGTSVQNEHGLYAGATWQPSRAWLVQGYADYSHSSWPRYQATAPSDAIDLLASVRHNYRRWTFEGRYRLHIRQRDNAEKSRLMNRPEHRMRLRVGCEVSPLLTLQTQADAVRALTSSGSRSVGFMLSQHAAVRWRWLKADAHVGWFRTDDYDSRIYQYERSVRYDFSFPMSYGRGLRYSLLVGARMGSGLALSLKASTLNYMDRSIISSGLQQIDHSSMTDLLLQLTYKF